MTFKKIISGGVNNVLVMGLLICLCNNLMAKHSDEKRKLKDESIAHNAPLKTNAEEQIKRKIPPA